MIQVCIMSAHEAQLGSEKKVFLTLMGACELTCPTISRQIVMKRQRERNGKTEKPKQIFLTVMGATEIKAPTLAQEFIDLRDMLANRSMTVEDWDRSVPEIGRSDIDVHAYTLMGAFSDCELPTENEEIDSLALQQHLGIISPEAAEVLKCGIGQKGAERRAALRRAIGTSVTA